MAESFTNELLLSMFAQNERFPVVSAAKLNANWQKIDAAVMGQGSGFPTTFTVGKLFLKTGGVGRGAIYKNTGTFDTPVWTALIRLDDLAIADISGLQAALDAKASISYVDAAVAGALSNADVLMQKPFFSHHGFLPANTILENLFDCPAFDQSSGGAQSSRPGARRNVSSGIVCLNSWDLGQDYTKVLFIGGPLIATGGSNNGIYLCKTLDGGHVPSDGVENMNEANSTTHSLYKLPGFSTLAASDGFVYRPVGAAWAERMALYIDCVAHRAVSFVRRETGQWFRIHDVTDAVNIPMTGIRFAGIRQADGYMIGPVGIYAE